MALPDAPTTPRHLLIAPDRLVLVGTEGDISHLHPDRMILIDPPRRPFSGDVTQAALLDADHLAATWVEREIGIARMAVLDLSQPLQDGPDLPTLRAALDANQLDNHQVAGAIWSHVLDAEPLALCAHEGDLVFCTHRRGLYRVKADSNEVWRRKALEWPELSDLPDGSVVVEIISTEDSIWVFSLGGGYAELNAADGEIIEQGILRFKAKVERVWHGEGEWMFGLSHKKIARWQPEQGISKILFTTGPVQHAIWHGREWWMTGWREDLIWDQEGLRRKPRPEIGIHLLRHPDHGPMVLDNIGQWSPFRFSSD